MIEILSEYLKEAESVLEENPVLQLEKLMGGHKYVTSGEIIQLSIKMRKQWNNFAKYRLEMCIVLTEEECNGNELVYKYDFTKDISEIIQSGEKRSQIYYLNSQFKICKIKPHSERLTIEKCSVLSKEINKIVLHLGMKGIDVLVDGVVFLADNFLSSYKDLMDTKSMLSICDYDKLLKGFYEQNIRFDINKRYFLRKNDIPKEYHEETIDKYSKLLRNKPEEFFEIDFVRYLKDHCRDAVVKEYTTVTGDRYDVLVLSEDNQVYVFEIKWLGRSITTGMKVFDKFNSEERAISGAYQLLDYVSNADTYKEYFLEFPVYCAILLIFDARDINADIVYPEDVAGKPNIDLNKRLFMEKNKVNASSVYARKRK